MFFGSSDVGLAIGQECVAAGKKPVLELAGNDGFVVWKDADLDAAARSLSECFYGSAQICMVPKYALIHPAIAEEFTEKLMKVVSDIKPGYPEDPNTLLSPVLKADLFYDFLAEAKSLGSEVLCGGNRVNVDNEPDTMGLFFEPTIVKVEGLDNARKLSCVNEETFFPLLPIVVVGENETEDLLETVIDFLNQNKFGLRNSLWSASAEVAQKFVAYVSNGGQLKINDPHLAHSYVSSHGGTGLSGGTHGEMNYPAIRTSHLQAVVWGREVPAHVRPDMTV
jgi:acyl-CoA reductase-like NAD-dependent aldehyde dehydrogenase